MRKKIQIHKIAQLTGHKGSIFALAESKTQQYLLSGAGDGWIVEWDLAAPDLGQLIAKVDGNVFSLLQLAEERLMIAGNMHGGLHWVNLDDPSIQKNIQHHQKGVFGIYKINNHILSLGGAGLLTKWDIASKRALESIQLSAHSLRALAFAKNKNQLAIGASDHNIYIVDASSLALLKVIEKAHDNSVFALHYSPDERYLFSGGRDAHLKVWEVDKHYENISAQAAHWYTINAIAWHPQFPIFATASRDKTVKIWDAHSFELLKVIDTIKFGGHINSVNALHWSSYNNYLISASDDRSLIVWAVELDSNN